MDFTYVLAIIILVVSIWRAADSQVLREELQEYNIDPLNFNGTEPYTELTIDQIILQAMGGAGMAENLVLGDDGTILAELDMKLTRHQFDTLYEAPTYQEAPAERVRGKRKAIKDAILRWDNGVIPYKFIDGHFQDKERYMIRAAMTEWEKYTCLRFRPATRADYNLVRFQNGAGCNSQLGMVSGEQALNLDRNGCRFKGLYLHEIGHSIGLVHEHQLPTRDQFIEILYNNVQPNMRIWFNKYSGNEVDQMKVKYEYSSVMHYGITAFSSDGKSQTIRALQPAKEKMIGRVYRKELSFTDVKIVNLMYKCAAKCDADVVCNDGGYIDQNCRCQCPDGTDSCTKSSPTVDPTLLNAHDDWACMIWVNQGECTRNPRFMLDGCKKACHVGDNDDITAKTHITTWAWQWLCVLANACPKDWTIMTVRSATRTTVIAGDWQFSDVCKDVYDSSKCEIWKEHGECIVNRKWMEHKCKQTCKLCENSGFDPETDCVNAHKNVTECEKWAGEGECQVNSRWMPENCRSSCHMCGDSGVTPTEQPDNTDEETGTCEDKHNTVECQEWAAGNECDKNPDWMIPNCRKSCNKCSGDSNNGGTVECKNTWDDSQCEGWSRDQECLKNSEWMNKNCHKACTRCTPDDGGSTAVTTRRPPTTEQDHSVCINNHRSDQECATWAQHGHCHINKWMLLHCAKACGSCTQPDTTTTPSSGGRDEAGYTTQAPLTTQRTMRACSDDSINCGAWANHGFCEDNPGVALRMCRKSCHACTSQATECYDKNVLCPVWMNGGQCQRNGGYMLRNCQKSCAVC